MNNNSKQTVVAHNKCYTNSVLFFCCCCCCFHLAGVSVPVQSTKRFIHSLTHDDYVNQSPWRPRGAQRAEPHHPTRRTLAKMYRANANACVCVFVFATAFNCSHRSHLLLASHFARTHTHKHTRLSSYTATAIVTQSFRWLNAERSGRGLMNTVGVRALFISMNVCIHQNMTNNKESTYAAVYISSVALARCQSEIMEREWVSERQRTREYISQARPGQTSHSLNDDKRLDDGPTMTGDLRTAKQKNQRLWAVRRIIVNMCLWDSAGVVFCVCGGVVQLLRVYGAFVLVELT